MSISRISLSLALCGAFLAAGQTFATPILATVTLDSAQETAAGVNSTSPAFGAAVLAV